MTKEDIEKWNKWLESIGLPSYIIDGDIAYPSEYHRYLGVGYQLEVSKEVSLYDGRIEILWN